MAKKPFSLTYILYDDEDGIFGWLMALMSLAPVFIIVILCSCILVHRDMHSVFLLLAMISCTLLNVLLKRIIKQPRPMSGGVQETYGMPSNHSQFISCFAVYITLWLVNRVSFTHTFQRYFFISALWIVWLCVVYSRLYLEEHSPAQVAVGVIAGLVYGGFLYWFNEEYCRKCYRFIASIPPFSWFEFKDYSMLKNVVNAEYDLAQSSQIVCMKEDIPYLPYLLIGMDLFVQNIQLNTYVPILYSFCGIIMPLRVLF